MANNIPHDLVPNFLRERTGRWVKLLEGENVANAHSRVNNWRPGSAKRPKVYGPRFEFRVVSNGYGTGTADIEGRHMPILIPATPRSLAEMRRDGGRREKQEARYAAERARTERLVSKLRKHADEWTMLDEGEYARMRALATEWHEKTPAAYTFNAVETGADRGALYGKYSPINSPLDS